jgi:hypothetical protein
MLKPCTSDAASPSLLVMPLRTKPFGPELPSATVTEAFTDTILWLGGQMVLGVMVTVHVGGVRSTLIALTPALLVLPATSETVAEWLWLAPSGKV